MTHDLIDLDGRRSAVRQLETEARRRFARTVAMHLDAEQAHLVSLAEQMCAEPARTWAEVMQKWQFLLERYSTTADAGDESIQRLIQRAVGDMERLRKREDCE